MDEEMLELIWTNHGPIFRYWFTEHREKERYTDATIGCEGKLYAVHKLVLATCSNYFDEVFEHTEGKHPVLLLHDVKQHELEAILCYMYTGSANVSQLNLSRFMMVAKALQIKGLAVPDGDSSDPLVAVENPQVDDNKGSSSGGYCWQESEMGSMQSMSDSSELHEDMDNVRQGAGGVGKKEDMDRKKSDTKDQYSFPGFKYKSVEGANDGDLIKKREVLEKIISQTERQFITDGKQGIMQEKAGSLQQDSAPTIKTEVEEYIDQKKPVKKEKLSPTESGSSKIFKGTMKRNLNGQKKSSISKVKTSKFKSMKKHLLSGEKSYKCLQCPASFTRKYALRRHVQNLHVDVEDFVCTYCHAKFASKEFLTLHMETHDKSKPYVCTLCHASFSRKDKLTVHIKNHETEGKGKVIAQVKNFSSKVFVCNECPATFENHSLFVEHSQMHAGERQFPCTVCPAAFAKKVHLSRHFLTHKGFGSKDKLQDCN
ncbi:myoneurin-like [Macrobrachium rosenbergii]|uniref:myoneurin-like n=1 Tax=Macrobrachium rosenbergii TaxID=79674 RepID=UPI0034D40042